MPEKINPVGAEPPFPAATLAPWVAGQGGGVTLAKRRGWTRRQLAGAGLASFDSQCKRQFLSTVLRVPKRRQKAGWLRCPCHVPDFLC